VPPRRYEGCPTSSASVSKAVVTVGPVHEMLWAASAVVVGRSCGLQVHVLPEVSYRPTDVGAERERSDTRSLQRGRVSQQLLPRRGCGLDARRGELGGVVPDGVLVGALEPDPVELAVVVTSLFHAAP